MGAKTNTNTNTDKWMDTHTYTLNTNSSTAEGTITKILIYSNNVESWRFFIFLNTNANVYMYEWVCECICKCICNLVGFGPKKVCCDCHTWINRKPHKTPTNPLKVNFFIIYLISFVVLKIMKNYLFFLDFKLNQ